ncbi:MAG: DNA topoisomerase [Lachnospiraceae bacterium]|nr:DNA topoisomerase [Lachnospiraceae bacterium]
MSTLVIAEKPSVAQAIAKVIGAYKRQDGYLEGNGYLVSWCFGHLAEYVMPDFYDSRYQYWRFEDLPIIPDKWELSVAREKEKQFRILAGLMNPEKTGEGEFLVPVECVVNACDAGREGELIFKHAYELSGCGLPVKRLWINSLEDNVIAEGFANLKDGSEYAGLLSAAVCRAQADWLVGINATRAFTTLYHKKLAVGRVQTPTLAMVVERQKKIDNFQKETYFQVRLEAEGISAISGKVIDEADCDALVSECQGKMMEVTKVERVTEKSSPPALYDLTTLQREANRFYGYTAQETLSIMQELYEERLVTYPRTDSQYITPDMEGTVLDLLDAVPDELLFLSGPLVGKNISRIVNAEKVSDHHAILPTREAFAHSGSLDGMKKDIFNLIVQRLVQAVSGDCVLRKTIVNVRCAGHGFTAKGKEIIEPGYTAVEEAFLATMKGKDNCCAEAGNPSATDENEADGAVFTDDAGKVPEADFSGLKEGMEIKNVLAVKCRRYTSPPHPYTEDTLLSAMETAGKKEFDRETEKKGLGTPATRASMIEKLVSSGYAVRKGKQILPTKEGAELIEVMPDSLKSASLTAEWENRLLEIERGKAGPEEFMCGITGLLSKMLADCEKIPEDELRRFDTREVIGRCPLCGRPVYEGNRNFHCADQSCKFAIWKESNYLSNMKKTITKSIAQDFLSKGRTHADDFYSAKSGKNFVADLVMQIEDGRVRYSMEFPPRKPSRVSAGKKHGAKTGDEKRGAKTGDEKRGGSNRSRPITQK